MQTNTTHLEKLQNKIDAGYVPHDVKVNGDGTWTIYLKGYDCQEQGDVGCESTWTIVVPCKNMDVQLLLAKYNFYIAK